MEHVDLLLQDMMLLTMDQERNFYPRASVAIRQGKIIALGPGNELKDCRAKKVISVPHGLVMPGLINCHTHETLTRGICEDLVLKDWLEQICFPLDAAYTAEIMAASAAMNQLEMIKSGTTTFVDIYRHPFACAEVLEKSGLRGILSPQVIDEPQGVGETLESNLALFEAWHGKAEGRVMVWFGLHALYSNYLESYSRVKEMARQKGVGLHTHLAETAYEVQLCRGKYGLSPVALLNNIGVLDNRTLCAHCVHLSDEDLAILADTQTGVVYNPSSNMKIASGIAPIDRLLAAKGVVALGTDSNLSNNNLDMFEEMRTGGMLQKLSTGDAKVLSCLELLEMATINGARALGLDEEIGSVAVGKKADLIIVDFSEPHLWPIFTGDLNNILEQLVYAAAGSDVVTTIVDGRVLMEDRRVLTLKQEELRAEVQKAAEWLCARAGIRKKTALNHAG